MSDIEIFAEAKRVFELLPGLGTMEQAVAKLASAGVPLSRIRGWALGIAAEYGIWDYIGPSFERLMRGAAKLARVEGMQADV
jgi:hypothetical protein